MSTRGRGEEGPSAPRRCACPSRGRGAGGAGRAAPLHPGRAGLRLHLGRASPAALLHSGRARPGRAAQDRSTPVPPHPHPPLGPGTAAPLQCSPLRPGGPHTVATLCRVGEGLSAADLLKIRPLAKWNLKCVVFVSLLT